MKYYSDKTKKLYDSVELLTAAETEFDKENAAKIKAQEERKARATEIEAARKEVLVAQERYNKLVNKFIKDYGSYHSTITREIDSMADLFDFIFR